MITIKRIHTLIITAAGVISLCIACHRAGHTAHIQGKARPYTHYTQIYNDEYSVYISLPVCEQTPAFNYGINTIAEHYRQQFMRYLQADTATHPQWQYELHITDSVYMCGSRIVSALLTCYTYLGGAHGSTEYISCNYDVRRQRMLKNEEILDLSDTLLINKLLAEHFVDNHHCFDTLPHIGLPYTLLLTREGLQFIYGHYVLGCYACGEAVITIPYAQARSIMKTGV